MKNKVTIKTSIGEGAPVDVLIGRAAMVGFVITFGAYFAAEALVPGLV